MANGTLLNDQRFPNFKDDQRRKKKEEERIKM